VAIERAVIANTKTELEVVSVMVQKAFKFWSSDSTNTEVAETMNSALDEAYDIGVPIAVSIAQHANGNDVDINEKVYDRLGLKNKIVISTVQDKLHSSRIYRAKVYTFTNSGYLHIDIIELNGNEAEKIFNITNLKPNQIGLFTPIIPSRAKVFLRTIG